MPGSVHSTSYANQTATFQTASVTRYIPFGNCPIPSSTLQISNANIVQIRIYDNGTLADLGLRVITNGRGTASTFDSYVAGSIGSMTMSIGAGATGDFTDSVNTDSVSSGDSIYSGITTGTGGGDLIVATAQVRFASDSASAGLYTMFGPSFGGDGIQTNGLGPENNYYPLMGGSTNFTNNSETANNSDLTHRAPGTLSHMQTYALTNNRTNACTVKARKGASGTDQNLSVSITGLTTGHFVDSSNTDAVVASDVWKSKFTTGAEASNLLIALSYIAVNWLPTDTKFDIACTNSGGGSSTSFAAPSYYGIGGRVFGTTTENNAESLATMGFNAEYLRAQISLNLSSVSTTLDLRINGASGSLALTIPATTTGFFEDTTNLDVIVKDDTLSYRTATPDWLFDIHYIAMMADPGSGITPGNDSFVHHYNSVILG